MANNQCPQCGKSIDAEMPGGACPSCLMAMAAPPSPQVAANGSHAPTTPFVPGTFAPKPQDLTGYFANLELLELIGHGGMGAVYRARQINLDRIVALKIMSPGLMADPSFAERFTREARTLARLNHPNIVTVYDFGHEVGPQGDLHYLVMELIQGVNLRAAIAAQTISPEQALAIVPKVCEALQYAHDQGIVHRDIKPENILIGENAEVKIADFGLAKILERPETELTLTGTHQVLGTRNYMAPEQIEKPDTVDHRADIYSLGVVFYELLTGELPLGRFSLPSEKAAITQRLDDVVLKTLEKEPKQRYQQASEVKTAVEKIENWRPPTKDLSASAEDSPLPAESNAELNESNAEPTQHTAGKSKYDQLSLPFKGEDIHGGFSDFHGLAHFDGHQLELEYQTVLLGWKKLQDTKASVPANLILRATFKSGTFSDSIEIQCRNMSCVEDIPSAKQGKLRLITEKKNTKLARQFAEAINGQAPSFVTPSKPDPVDVQPSGENHLPFAIDGADDGFSEAMGIATLNDKAIVLEYDVRDGFGLTKSDKKTSTIPFANIIHLDWRKGVFKDRLEIQTNSMEAVKKVPGTTQGKVTLSSKKVDREHAIAFTKSICHSAGLPLPEATRSTLPLNEEQQLVQTTRDRLRWPRRGLLVVAILNMIYLSVYLSALILHFGPWLQTENQGSMIEQVMQRTLTPAENDSFWFYWLGSFLSAFEGQTFLIANVILAKLSIIGVLIMSLVAYHRMRHVQSYHFLIAAIILMALPIHAGFLVGLPIAIWFMVILLDQDTKQAFALEAQSPGEYLVVKKVGAARMALLGFALFVVVFLITSALVVLTVHSLAGMIEGEAMLPRVPQEVSAYASHTEPEMPKSNRISIASWIIWLVCLGGILSVVLSILVTLLIWIFHRRRQNKPVSIVKVIRP